MRALMRSVKFHWKALMVSAVFVGALILLSWFIFLYSLNEKEDSTSEVGFAFWAAFLVSLSATAVWAVVAFIAARNYLRNVDEYIRVNDFPWDRSIRQASKRIEVNVHGWDGLFINPRSLKGEGGELGEEWVKSARARAWIKFFKNKGTLRLILPSFPSDGDDAELHAKLASNLKVILERTGKDESAQRREVEQTVELANQLNALADNDGVVETFYVKDLRWICSVRFDDDRILLSTYTTQRRTNVVNGSGVKTVPFKGEFPGPAFAMDPSVYPSIEEWVKAMHMRDGDASTE